MDFRKLSANGDSTSVTLPKAELEELGVVDDNGELIEDVWARVTHDGDGQFSVSVVSGAE